MERKEIELSLSHLFLSPESMSYQSWKRGFGKYTSDFRLVLTKSTVAWESWSVDDLISDLDEC